MTMIELVQELRGERSQQEFAELVGISQVHVSMLLAGERLAGRKVVTRLIEVFPERKDEILRSFFAQKYGNPDSDIPQAEPVEEGTWE